MVNSGTGVIQTLTIAKMVHEIRNPLTLINSSLQLIETTHPEVKDFQFWSQTLEDVEYLNQLLDDLAVYSDDRRFFMCEAGILTNEVEKSNAFSLWFTMHAAYGKRRKRDTAWAWRGMQNRHLKWTEKCT